MHIFELCFFGGDHLFLQDDTCGISFIGYGPFKRRTKIHDYLRHRVFIIIYPDVPFVDPEVSSSFMSPDGGITYLIDKNGNKHPILIGEVKNQGTNSARLREGLPKQAKGNAVERLGKNVIGFRTYLLDEAIFPYVCFGDGCDFERGSSILDRVFTIAMFGSLNEDHTFNEGPNGSFNRGSYYFKSDRWTIEELYDIMYEVAKRSIYYYFSKYGEKSFR